MPTSRCLGWTPPLEGHEYIWVSKADPMYSISPETFVFGADEWGELIWTELEASRTGDYSHEALLGLAGYTCYPEGPGRYLEVSPEDEEEEHWSY